MNDMEDLVSQMNTRDWQPSKGRTALLLIDLEEYFRDLIDPVLNNLLGVIETARSRRIPLVFTRHRHLEGKDPGVLGKWWNDLIWEDTPEAQLLPELNVTPDEVVVEKDRYSAFHHTDLENFLKKWAIRDVVIGGVMTNLCCETTAREAFVRDYRVFFLADGTSTVSRDLHLSTLANLAYGFATLMTCAGFGRSLRNW